MQAIILAAGMGKRLKEGEKALLHEEDQFYIGNELFLIRFL